MENLDTIANQFGNIIEQEKKVPNVLIVEDDEVERLSLKTALEAEGIVVEAVEKGFDAENMVKNVFFDVVIVDYRLPDIDGLNLTKKLKITAPDLMPVFVTAHSSVEVAVESMKIGAYDYMAKPLNIPNLIKTIYKIMEDKDILFKSRKKLSEMVSTNSIQYSPDDDKISIVSTPDTNVLADGSVKTGFFKKIKNFFISIKNYYWGS